MAELFRDILPSILETKKDVLSSAKDYVPFMVNRALSYHSDCLFDANEMNCLNSLDKTLQYKFLLSSIRAARRPFVKWAKSTTSKDLEAVMTYFSYTSNEAETVMNLFSTEQLAFIRNQVSSNEAGN